MPIVYLFYTFNVHYFRLCEYLSLTSNMLFFLVTLRICCDFTTGDRKVKKLWYVSVCYLGLFYPLCVRNGKCIKPIMTNIHHYTLSDFNYLVSKTL